MAWMSVRSGMNPINWGWKIDKDELVTIMTDVNVVPDIFLKIIPCNCKICCMVTAAPVEQMAFHAVLYVVMPYYALW